MIESARIDTADGKIAVSLPLDGIEDIHVTADGKQCLALATEYKKGVMHFLDPQTLEARLSMPLKFAPRSFGKRKMARSKFLAKARNGRASPG